MSELKLSFSQFLKHFPVIELPITLTSDTHHLFSRENIPLSEKMIKTFIQEIDYAPATEFTEYIACFQLPENEHYYGIVFWRADLMEYEYILATFDKKGVVIAKKIIAGTKSNGKSLLKRIATIDEDLIILVAEGEGLLEDKLYQAESSKTYHLEILPTGDVMEMINNN